MANSVYTVNVHGCPTVAPHNDRPQDRGDGNRKYKLRSTRFEKEAGLLEDLALAHKSLNVASNTIMGIHDTIEKLKDAVGFDKSDNFQQAAFKRLDQLLILILDLRTRNSLTDMILPIMQYLGTLTNQSLSQKFGKWVMQIALTKSDGHGEETVWEPIGEQYEAESGSQGWFEQNWEILTQGKFGKKLAGLLNVLIMAGLLPEKTQNSITTETFKILHVHSLRKKSPSIFHHLFSTLDWMVDSVIPAITTSNFALLFTDADEAEIDSMYVAATDMCYLNVTGQQERIKEKYDISDEAELLVYIMNTTAAHIAVKKRLSNHDASYQREITSRLIKLDKLCSDIQSFWHASGMRQKPYAVLFRGGSSVGKSTMAGIAHHAICQANNLPMGKEFCCTINGSDKYQSDYRSQHICVIFDDMGNTKPEKAEGNPLFTLIQFINNMHCSALSPEAEKKGKNDIRAKIVLVTTNTSDLHSWHFSCNPTSIMRRFDLVVDVKLKKECTSVSGGILSMYAGIAHPDIWDLTLSTVGIERLGGLADAWHLVPVYKDANIVDFVNYLVTESPKHFAIQQKLVENGTDLDKQEHCARHSYFCLPCPACATGRCPEESAYIPLDHKIDTILEAETGRHAEFASAADQFFTQYHTLEPCRASVNDDFTRGCCDAGVVEGLEGTENLSLRDRVKAIHYHSKRKLSSFSKKLKDAAKDPNVKILGAIAGFGLAAFAINQMFKEPKLTNEGAMIEMINQQAKTPRQIVERDNAYQRVYCNMRNYPSASISTTIPALEAKIDNNLHVAVVKEMNPLTGEVYETDVQWCNTFPLKGCEWVFPGHQFCPGRSYQVFFRSHPGIGIKRFQMIVDESNTRPIPGTDGCIVHAPRGGDVSDFSKYLPDDDFELEPGTPVKIYQLHRLCVDDVTKYVPPSAVPILTKIRSVKEVTVKDVGSYMAIDYECDTYKGLCGAMIFTVSRNPVLIGMHTAGNGRSGAGIILDRKQVFATKQDRLEVAETDALRTEIYGVDTSTTPDVHGYNAVHYLEEDNLPIAIGQQGLPSASFKSDVIDSPIKEKLEKALGLDPMFGAPLKKAARPSRHKHMSAVTKNRTALNPSILKLAAQDLRAKLKKTLLSNDKFKEFVHPLSMSEALNGVPEVKGFDPVNPLTSMSHPLNGAKYKYFEQNDIAEKALFEAAGIKTQRFVTREVLEDGKFRYVYELKFDPEKADVEQEIERNLGWSVEGKRMNMIFKCNLKDEVVTLKKINNDTIRVFAGAPVSLVVITRMLTLTLVNAMTYFPKEFESAVGVNASGKDWEYIHEIFCKNPDRIGEGDFSKYDQNIRPEESYEAYDFLRCILRECGFSEELIAMFDGLATECMFPIYESDGFVYQALGSNPSGHALTVIINGIINCLYMRYAYYSMHQKDKWLKLGIPHTQLANHRLVLGEIPLFHEVIALQTYGDDNVWGCDKRELLFNMITVGEELALVGIKYTDGKKNIATEPFIHLDDTAFLKRKFKYHDMIGARVGPLDVNSIYKSLLFCKRQKGNKDARLQAQIIGGNFSQAINELFLHGEEAYDTHLKIFNEVLHGEVDQDGQLISNFFFPKTKQELVEAYDKTTCAYRPALEAMVEGPMEKEAGVWPVTYQEFVSTVDGINDVINFVDSRAVPVLPILPAWHPLIYRDFRNQDLRIYINETRLIRRPWWSTPTEEWAQKYLWDTICEYYEDHGLIARLNLTADGYFEIPPVECLEDVYFREWCDCNDRLSWLLGDYRSQSSFTAELESLACDMLENRILKRDIGDSITYLWKNVDNELIMPKGDLRVITIMRKLHRRNSQTNRIFIPEIDDRIWSFLVGPTCTEYYAGRTFLVSRTYLADHNQMHRIYANWNYWLSATLRHQLARVELGLISAFDMID